MLRSGEGRKELLVPLAPKPAGRSCSRRVGTLGFLQEGDPTEPQGNSQAPGGRNLCTVPGRSRCVVCGGSQTRVRRQLFPDLIWQMV